MHWFINTLVIVSLLLLIILSITDVCSRTIGNRIILLLLITIIPLSLLKYQTLFILPSLCALAIGFLLFTLNLVGAGDVKLIAVLMLMIPNDEIFPFFFFTTFAGLGLIIISWLFFRKSVKENGLPYGVAISLGFMTNLVLSN